MAAIDPAQAERIKTQAIDTIKDLVEKYEVPREFVDALLDAYTEGALNMSAELQTSMTAELDAYQNKMERWAQKVMLEALSARIGGTI